MKTPRTLQTKRSRPRAGFRMLHAVTNSSRKRKQRASTTAAPEDLGEVPGVGVPLALVVILLLHVAAIAGIWIHNRWSTSSDLEGEKVTLKDDVAPTLNPNLQAYLVGKNDTVESIAREAGVDVNALVRANDGISEYQAGWKINLPPRRFENVSPADSVAGRVEAPLGYAPTSRPLIQTRDDQSIPGSQPGELVQVGGAEAEDLDRPLLVNPNVGSATRQIPPASTPVRASGRTHVVRSGETLWRIARNNGVSVDALKRANPNVNVNALKIGARLTIPAGR